LNKGPASESLAFSLFWGVFAGDFGTKWDGWGGLRNGMGVEGEGLGKECEIQNAYLRALVG
jgi:hypothetical protein